MAGNLVKVQNKVAKEIFYQFSQTGEISKNISWRSDLFSAQENTGATVSVRRPAMVDISSVGFAPGTYDASNSTASTIPSAPTYTGVTDAIVPLSITKKFVVNLNFALDEVTVNLSKEQANERYIMPAVRRMRRLVDNYIGGVALLSAGQVIGTPGSYSSTPLEQFAAAQALLNNRGLDMSDPRVALTPEVVGSKLQTTQAALFNPVKSIERLYRRGEMGEYAGFDFYRSPLLPSDPGFTLPTGCTVAALTAPTVWTPTTTISVSGMTPSSAAANTYAGGLVKFTQSGGAPLNWVNPDTKVDIGVSGTFAIVSHSAISGGAGTFVISEPLIGGSSPYQNVNATLGAGSTMTFLNSTSTAGSTPSLVFDKKAIMAASPRLNLPKGLDYYAQEEVDGVNLSVIESHDPYTFTKIHALQCIIGASVYLPEGLVRVY